MGEAKRRKESGAPQWRWKDPSREPPPDDAHDLAIAVTITCPCYKGGKVIMCAGRQHGEWVIPPFEHEFDIDYWLRLPALPAGPALN